MGMKEAITCGIVKLPQIIREARKGVVGSDGKPVNLAPANKKAVEVMFAASSAKRAARKSK